MNVVVEDRERRGEERRETYIHGESEREIERDRKREREREKRMC